MAAWEEGGVIKWIVSCGLKRPLESGAHVSKTPEVSHATRLFAAPDLGPFSKR